MRKFLIIFLILLPVAAVAKEFTFPMSGWDKYDGSERLGAMQEQCQDEAWPKGYTANQASALFAKMSKAEAERIIVDCDPKRLASKGEPSGKQRHAKRDVPPFERVKRDRQYHCWVDAEGRHRVAFGDPKARGWCFGPAVGDK
jgi:hypothetical protein